ncbi:MAG: aminotransferase class IV [Acidimicrobiales bacterium]
MHQPQTVWIDGELRPIDDATISVFSHAVMRGTAVFDVLRIVQAPGGPAAIGLRPHLARLERSMAMMGMEPSVSLATLERAVSAVVAENQGAATVKTVAAWAEIPAKSLPVSLTPSITMGAFVPDPLEPTIPAAEPVSLRTALAPKLPAAMLPPALKVAASYTVGVRETMAAMAEGFDSVIFKTVDGLLAEGTTQSVFVVRGERLVVPPLDVVLDGITRRLVLDVGAYLGYHCEVRPVTWPEVEAADELFLCSTNAPVAPVARLDDHKWSTVGPVSSAIANEIARMIADAEHPLARRWLTPV